MSALKRAGATFDVMVSGEFIDEDPGANIDYRLIVSVTDTVVWTGLCDLSSVQ